MPYMTISEASDHLDISIDTLRRWDKSGIIRADRNTVGHRIFDTAEIQRVNSKRRCREAAAKDHYSVLKANDKTKLTSIDLFAGAGGTASGLENAGFSHQLLSEIDPFAVATLRLNRPNWNVVEGDVANIDFHPFYNKIDLLEGGFPCQAFSYAGKSMGFEDTRGTLFFEFARAVKEVAQKRERLIIIGVRSDIDTPILLPKERDYIISLWEAIGHCPPSPGQSYPEKKRRILDLVPPGGYWRDLPSDIQKEYLGGSYHLSGGKTGMARRLSWDEPSLTLTCSPAQKQTERCHPEETRPLNIREYARIQSFPDDWQFAGSVAQQYKQIGNAVPSNLAFHIGRAVRAMLEGRVCDEYIKLEKVPNSDIINSEQLPLFNI